MEQKKRNLFFLITTILTIVITIYVLYITVYDQILSQSQGYFYAGFFGFVLLLVFLLCNLLTKLIATSAAKQETIAWKIVGICILLIFCAIYIATRLNLSSNLAATESPVYNSAIAMVEGNYYQHDDLIRNALNNPSNYVYSLILSLVFSVFSASSKAYIITNAVIYSICIIFVYLISAKLTDRLCGLIAAVLCLIYPSYTFSSYSYNSNAIFTLFTLICLFLFISLLVTINGYNAQTEFAESLNEIIDNSDEKSLKIKSIVYTILSSICIGLLIFTEPVMLIMVLIVILTGFMLKKKYALNLVIALAASLMVFVLLSFAKSSHMDEDFGTVISEELGTFDFLHDNNNDESISGKQAYEQFSSVLSIQNDVIVDNYYFLYRSDGEAAYTDLSSTWVILENQLIYIFLLIMLLSCNIIALKENMVNFTFINSMILGYVILALFEQNRYANKNLFITILVIACGISIHYLYLNHHPEQRIVLNTIDILEKSTDKHYEVKKEVVTSTDQLSEADFIKRAKALVFIGNDDDLYNQIKLEEHRLAMRSGKIRANDAFDDMDEEDFFDKEDDVSIEKNEKTTPIDRSVPAYKSKPVDTLGDDNMYFDEEEAEQEEAAYKASVNNDNLSDTISTSPERHVKKKEVEKVEKIERPNIKPISKKKDSKSDSDKKKKEKPAKTKKTQKELYEEKVAAMNSSTSSSQSSPSGRAVRKIKTVGKTEEDAAMEKYLSEVEKKKQDKKQEDKYIPNPLPVPKKKEHIPMDYEVKNEASGWDYDYDVDDDDDWDV